MNKNSSFLMFSLLLVGSAAFWNEPHMAVARIAEMMMTPQQQLWMSALFKTWPSETNTLLEVSTWQDEIAKTGSYIKSMKQWHFADEPILRNFTGTIYTHYNVTSILMDTLQTLFNPTTTDPWAYHFAFRNLIHFIGDTHTPVHASALYSEYFPDGDGGGNSYWLVDCNYGAPCGNLHKMWDSGVLNFQNYELETQEILEEFEFNVSRIFEKWTFDELGPNAKSLDPKVWISEAHKVAEDYAYGLVNDTDHTLLPNYIPVGAEQAEILIAKAGRRLGLVIQKFFEIQNPSDPRYDNVSVSAGEVLVWVFNSFLIIIIAVYTFFICKSGKRTTEYSAMLVERSMSDMPKYT